MSRVGEKIRKILFFCFYNVSVCDCWVYQYFIKSVGESYKVQKKYDYMC